MESPRGKRRRLGHASPSHDLDITVEDIPAEAPDDLPVRRLAANMPGFSDGGLPAPPSDPSPVHAPSPSSAACILRGQVEAVQEEFGSVAGLRNTSNNCWLIAIVQVIANVPVLYATVREHANRELLAGVRRGTATLEALRQSFVQGAESARLDALASNLRSGQQHCAVENWHYMMDLLVNSPDNTILPADYEQAGPTTVLISGVNNAPEKCQLVELPDILFTSVTRTLQLQNMVDDVRSPHVLSPPSGALVVSITRGLLGGEVKSTPVTPNQLLVVAGTRFHLAAVIFRTGRTAACGHFTASVLDSDDSYMHFDGIRVTPSSEHTANSCYGGDPQHVVLAVYVRDGDLRMSCPDIICAEEGFACISPVFPDQVRLEAEHPSCRYLRLGRSFSSVGRVLLSDRQNATL